MNCTSWKFYIKKWLFFKHAHNKNLSYRKTIIDKNVECITPDKVNKSGTGNNANANEKQGTGKVQPQYKKATKASQIKSSQNKGTNPDKDMQDALLGDPIANTKKHKRPKQQVDQTVLV